MVTTFKHYTEGFSGTSLMGYVATSYKDLIAVFGPPTFVDDSGDAKVSAEWCLKFIDGTVATIYDWKEESTPEDLYDWHIGGKDIKAVDLVGLAMTQAGYPAVAVEA